MGKNQQIWRTLVSQPQFSGLLLTRMALNYANCKYGVLQKYSKQK